MESPSTSRSSHPVLDSTKVSLESDPADIDRPRAAAQQVYCWLADLELPTRGRARAVKRRGPVQSLNFSPLPVCNSSTTRAMVHRKLGPGISARRTRLGALAVIYERTQPAPSSRGVSLRASLQRRRCNGKYDVIHMSK